MLASLANLDHDCSQLEPRLTKSLAHACSLRTTGARVVPQLDWVELSWPLPQEVCINRCLHIATCWRTRRLLQLVFSAMNILGGQVCPVIQLGILCTCWLQAWTESKEHAKLTPAETQRCDNPYEYLLTSVCCQGWHGEHIQGPAILNEYSIPTACSRTSGMLP